MEEELWGWKSRRRFIAVSWVRIPPSPPLDPEELLTRREWLVLGSYFLLLALFVGSFAAISFVPALASSFALWIGPLFAAMGAHLIHFRKDHAGIWEQWGGPSQGAFIMIGVFFLGIGVFFVANAF